MPAAYIGETADPRDHAPERLGPEPGHTECSNTSRRQSAYASPLGITTDIVLRFDRGQDLLRQELRVESIDGVVFVTALLGVVLVLARAEENKRTFKTDLGNPSQQDNGQRTG